MNQRGFTVIELLALIVLLIVVGTTFWVQKTNLETSVRDDRRKTSINAMYYSLEEVYFAANKHYPQTLEPKMLPSVDGALFKDPNGVRIGDAKSDFRYEAKNCTGNACKSYSLRTTLENEADYVKTSRNN